MMIETEIAMSNLHKPYSAPATYVPLNHEWHCLGGRLRVLNRFALRFRCQRHILHIVTSEPPPPPEIDYQENTYYCHYNQDDEVPVPPL
jgi:hypothetical protein